jgi:hypothetical protein
VVAGSQLHDAGVENPSEPAAEKGAAPWEAASDMGGVCPPGGSGECSDRSASDAGDVAGVGEEPVASHGPLLAEARPSATAERVGRVTETISHHDILWLLERQSYRCALSGRELLPSTTSLDHMVSISRGGRHIVGNAQALQREVNRAKGTLTNEEFIQLCREVVAWADSKEKEAG